LSSQHDAALDHYGRLLTERLRRVCPQGQIETYFPASTEALVAQFNEVLARQTLREAMTDGVAIAPQRIWVIHDAGALAEHELQLMTRLVSHFPGANIRVVMLLGPARRSRKAFESLGRRFVRWDVEFPTAEQAQTMLVQARVEGCERLVSQLLRHLRPEVLGPDDREPAARPPEPFTFYAGDDGRAVDPTAGPAIALSRLGALRALPGRYLGRLQSTLRALKNFNPLQAVRKSAAGLRASAAELPARSKPGAPRPGIAAVRPSRLRWALAIGGLIGLSVAVSAWLHGAQFGALKPALQQPVKAARGAPEANPVKPATASADSTALPGKSSS
jgi:hypothetical protein